MTRFAPQLAGVALAAVVGALSREDPFLALVLAGLTVALSYWAWRERRGDPVERPWSAPADATTDSDLRSATASRSPTLAGRRPGAVAGALGRVEARQLALRPWFGIGIGFCVVMVMSFAPTDDGPEFWWQAMEDLPFLAHPLVGMVVLAGHRAATRADRGGAAELFASCPTTPVTRTWGALASAWVPMVAVAVFCVAYLAVLGLATNIDGGLVAAAVPILLAAIALAAGGIALGVALGGWIRNPLAPVVAVIAIGFASPPLASGEHNEASTRLLLSTMPTLSEGPALTTGQATANLAWLVVLTSVTVAVALRRGRRDEATPVATPALPATVPPGVRS